MRLDIVQLPYTIHRVLTDLLRFRHQPATPMGHALGLALQGRFNDPLSLALIIVRFAPATGSDLPDLPDAQLAHPLAPELHGGSAHAEPCGDGHVLLTRHRSQDNPATQRHLLRRSVCGLPLFQLRALSWLYSIARPVFGMAEIIASPKALSSYL